VPATSTSPTTPPACSTSTDRIIAQLVAVRHPGRARSLTSTMSAHRRAGHRLRVGCRGGLSFDPAYDPAGVARQLGAILTTPDPTPDHEGLDLPRAVPVSS
jgi:hypothetical protein